MTSFFHKSLLLSVSWSTFQKNRFLGLIQKKPGGPKDIQSAVLQTSPLVEQYFLDNVHHRISTRWRARYYVGIILKRFRYSKKEFQIQEHTKPADMSVVLPP